MATSRSHVRMPQACFRVLDRAYPRNQHRGEKFVRSDAHRIRLRDDLVIVASEETTTIAAGGSICG